MQDVMPHERNRAGARRVIGGIAVLVGVVVATVGLSAGPGLAFTGPEPLPSTPASNQASYWGSGCWKLDEAGGTTWTADADYSIVVLKTAQTDWVFRDVRRGDVLTLDRQAISHFIFCPPATTTTVATTTVPASTTVATTTVPASTTTTTTLPGATTTVPGATTTLPSSTSTVPGATTTLPSSTSTVPGATTTVPAATTTTIVDSQGPTTTMAEPATTTIADSQGPTTTLVASAGPTTSVDQTTTTLVASAGPVTSALPATGGGLPRLLIALGTLLVIVGGVVLLTTRRTAAS